MPRAQARKTKTGLLMVRMLLDPVTIAAVDEHVRARRAAEPTSLYTRSDALRDAVRNWLLSDAPPRAPRG